VERVKIKGTIPYKKNKKENDQGMKGKLGTNKNKKEND